MENKDNLIFTFLFNFLPEQESFSMLLTELRIQG